MRKLLYYLFILSGLFFSSLSHAQIVLEALEDGIDFTPSPKCLELVYDRNYGDGDHNFIYCAVQGPNGKKWLNLNLGAEYAKESSPYFNPEAVPTGYNDWKAFGSLFQKLRRSDGHELVEYLHTDIGSNVQNSTDWIIKTRGFVTAPITYPNSYMPYPVYANNIYSWTSSPLSMNYWVEDTNLNPCPSGYRVMTSADVISFFQSPQNINVMGGSMYSASLVKNTAYPYLTILTSPIYGYNTNSSIIEYDKIISITPFSHLNGNVGTSSLWVLVDAGDPSYAWFNGQVFSASNNATDRMIGILDRGYLVGGNIIHYGLTSVTGNDSWGGTLAAGIRCIQSN